MKRVIKKYITDKFYLIVFFEKVINYYIEFYTFKNTAFKKLFL